MKKNITLLLFTFLMIACSSEKNGNMIVQGKIKGLKKGKLYLQKMQDTTLISLDSVAILGDNNYKLTGNVDSPEIFFLTFKGSNAKERILFFGEEGVITINDKIESFGFNPEISGSKNQEILDKFNLVNKKFNNQGLEFIQKDFEAKKSMDRNLIAKVEKDQKRFMRRKILFATNFAITNSTYEAAPYIALRELYNANIQLLDTVNNSLSEKVKKSTYGVKLNNFVTKVKKDEGK